MFICNDWFVGLFHNLWAFNNLLGHLPNLDLHYFLCEQPDVMDGVRHTLTTLQLNSPRGRRSRMLSA